MFRTPVARTFTTSTRAPVARQAVAIRTRTLATIPPNPPDPTHPTDKPEPSDKPGSNSLLYIVAALAGVGAGGWWYSIQREPDAHQARQQDEARFKQKAQEAKEAGKATAHDAVREGQQGYDQAKF
ncbi:hypothetical protein EIP86_004879 [Pleurotus ostreatoroseus]|nr:hypothetical protein EIP86_004879 [Pleurotus ostreatoroseus]